MQKTKMIRVNLTTGKIDRVPLPDDLADLLSAVNWGLLFCLCGLQIGAARVSKAKGGLAGAGQGP